MVTCPRGLACRESGAVRPVAAARPSRTAAGLVVSVLGDGSGTRGDAQPASLPQLSSVAGKLCAVGWVRRPALVHAAAAKPPEVCCARGGGECGDDALASC